MKLLFIFSLLAFIISIINGNSEDKKSIQLCANILGEHLMSRFAAISKEEEIRRSYDKLVKEEQYDPRVELRDSRARIEKYVWAREEFALAAKQSLEQKNFTKKEKVNDVDSADFIRYMSAKTGDDATIVYQSNHFSESKKVEPTRSFKHTPNANFYLLNTTYNYSAVHVPTPIYDREPTILKKIEWSNIDEVYKGLRDSTKDLSFQLFCSESGFMRYYPAAPWFWSNQDDNLDLFDCRNTEWYINSATNSKNVMLMLDMSGSMLGQRYEVAKQTTEAILGTLSHNDYFNIMAFSKSARLLDSCNGTKGLLQATMRNKKALRRALNSLSSEGKADYDVALTLAFNKLLNLEGDYQLLTKEEMALMDKNASHGMDVTELNEHVLLASKKYLQSINNGGGGDKQGGTACENVIMLITDGSPSNNKVLIDKLNPNKDVRIFTFLIGEEAIDFNEVREMACDNRGYMVHIANMADVEEKIQYYIKRMSRVVGAKSRDKMLKWWTGVYREKLYLPRQSIYSKPEPVISRKHAVMKKEAAKRKSRIIAAEVRSRMFVTTVSYPVIHNKTFMGVAAVNIPLTEIGQKAHPSHIGAKSYFFMLDQNGFIMVHPQLRPINQKTRSQKVNYNNMDLLELEILQGKNIRNAQKLRSNNECEHFDHCGKSVSEKVRKNMIECKNEKTYELDILYATDVLDRVYPQVNSYYAECINNTDFVIGLAVAKDETHRIVMKKPGNYSFSDVSLNWVDKNMTWRLHPYWRYCFLNDSDTDITKEQAFVIYVEQMVATGKAPYLCTKRQYLVERLLIDLEATANLQASWERDSHIFKNELIHLAFFAGTSGMIRYHNWTIDGYSHEHPRDLVSQLDKSLGELIDNITAPLINELIKFEQITEPYNHFINTYNSKSSDDPYYRRAVRMPDTIVFDVSNKSHLYYLNETELTSYGLNENMTIVGQAYKAIYKDKAVLGVAGYEYAYEHITTLMSEHECTPLDDKKWCVLLDEHAYVFYTSQNTSYEKFLAGGTQVGKFFGSINRVSQRAMELLVKAKYYNMFSYVDHQASCTEEVAKTNTAGGRNQLYSLIRFVVHTYNYLVRLASTISGGYLIWMPYIPITNAYTSSFHESTDVYPCSKNSTFFFTNKNGVEKQQPITVQGLNERICAPDCEVNIEAAYVKGTNLLMVWINHMKVNDTCYMEESCKKLKGSDIEMEFKEIPSEPVCDDKRFYKSKANDVCYSIDVDKSEKVTPHTCSFSSSKPTLIIFALLMLKSLFVFLPNFS